MGKVLIGIIAKHYLKESKRPNVYIKNELKQAIFDNGAIAIGILPTREERVKVGSAIKDELTETEKEELVYQLNLCDGIILQGSAFRMSMNVLLQSIAMKMIFQFSEYVQE